MNGQMFSLYHSFDDDVIIMIFDHSYTSKHKMTKRQAAMDQSDKEKETS